MYYARADKEEGQKAVKEQSRQHCKAPKMEEQLVVAVVFSKL